jgi:MFS family permease
MLRRIFPEVYEGWLVAWSGTIVLLILGATIFYGMGPLFNPMTEEFGWSVGATALAFSLRSEVNGVAAPFVGGFIDRVGTQRVMLFGIAVSALGVFLISFQQELWQFYLLMLVVAVGSSTAGGQVVMVSTVTWFEEKRARALSYAMAGGALGGMLTFFVALLVDGIGWRGALRVMALILLLVGGVAGLNVRNRPSQHDQPVDGRRRSAEGGDEAPSKPWGVPFRVAVRSRPFWLLALAQASVHFTLTAVVVHQIPFMETRISPALAAAAAGLFAVASLVGRLAAGMIGDRLDKRHAIAAITALTTAGLPLLLVVHNFWAALPVVILLGIGTGGTIPLRTAILADYFGTKAFGSINGVAMFVGTAGAFFGPLVVGIGVDVTGSYAPGWLVTAAVSVIAIPAVLLALPPAELIETYRSRVRQVDPPVRPVSAGTADSRLTTR